MKLTESQLRGIIQEEVQNVMSEGVEMPHRIDTRTYRMEDTPGFNFRSIQPSSKGNVLQKALVKMGIRNLSGSIVVGASYLSSNGEWKLSLTEMPEHYIHEDGEVRDMSEIGTAKVVNLPETTYIHVTPSSRPSSNTDDHPKFVEEFAKKNIEKYGK